MEYLDLYDVNGNLTGESIPRTKDKGNVPEGKYIKLVLIFIQNSDNKFLFQTTSECKGHVIATTGGHVQSGQTSKEAIINEVSEELGIDIRNDNVIDLGYIIDGFILRFTFYVKKNINLDDVTLQSEEVESVSYKSVDEIEDLLQKGLMHKGHFKVLKRVLEYKNSLK